MRKAPTTSTTTTDLTSDLANTLGVRRAMRLRRLMRRTGLPPEALLDLAIELLDITSAKLSPEPIHRTAVGLGAARWRNVSAEDRSKVLSKAAKARWAKVRAGAEPGGVDQHKK
jgi:hypothetical protein